MGKLKINTDRHEAYYGAKPKGRELYGFNVKFNYVALGTWTEAQAEIRAVVKVMQIALNKHTIGCTFSVELDSF